MSQSRTILVRRIATSFCLAAIILVATSCGPSRPSEADGKAVVEPRYTPFAKTVGFEKTNGQDIGGGGVPTYRMSYKATFECTDVASGCCASTDAAHIYCTKAVKAGEQWTHTGDIFFEKSENGWLGRERESFR